MAKGLLIAAMDYSDVAEDEFHDWYDTEHIPERLAVPGFLNAERWLGSADPMIAYHAAVARGCNVDKPRNLAKSVTVE